MFSFAIYFELLKSPLVPNLLAISLVVYDLDVM